MMKKLLLAMLLLAGCKDYAVIPVHTLNLRLSEPPDVRVIGTSPQYFISPDVIDNHWAVVYKTEHFTTEFHQAEKHASNPVIAGDGGYVTVKRAASGTLQMWHQVYDAISLRYGVAYSESTDGLSWTSPPVGSITWPGRSNIVWAGISGQRASGPFIWMPEEAHERGYVYEMVYRDNDGIHIVGSNDGTDWQVSSDIHMTDLPSDSVNAVYWDNGHSVYRMTCRPKDRYGIPGDHIKDIGVSRRVALLTSANLFDTWPGSPRLALIPDNIDFQSGNFNFFYGMPVIEHGGIYWGFLWLFRMNDNVYTELAWSITGRDYQRQLSPRVPLIALGAEGAWDDGMVFAGNGWIEQGDQWWIYYAGWDGDHKSTTRVPGIGIAKIRKEGFASLKGPISGGNIVTRPILWPGGDLLINADITNGWILVRVSDSARNVISGYDYDDFVKMSAPQDGVRLRAQWNSAQMDSLVGQTIRLEFFVKKAHMYTFQAEGS